MNTRSLKTGHWLATKNQYHSFSTGDIFETLEQIAEGEFDTPIAIYMSENPIKSQHSYLWTPVVDSSNPLVVSYANQNARIEWSDFEQLVDDIETLRGAGFRVKDIKSGEPRVRDLETVIEELGLEEYQNLVERIAEYRGGTLFEVALTASTKP